MEHKLEILKEALLQGKIVTVSAASELTQLKRREIINYVKASKNLRIYDQEKQKWLNENVDGHC